MGPKTLPNTKKKKKKKNAVMKIKKFKKNRAETLGDYNNAVNSDTGSPQRKLCISGPLQTEVLGMEERSLGHYYKL